MKAGDFDLKYRYITTLTKRECKKRVNENVDVFSFSFGEEHLSGWVVANVFSLSHRTGKLRMHNSIFNKALGTFTERDGCTYVTFKVHKGLTDFLSLFAIFVGSFLILSIKFFDENAFVRAGFAIICCLFAAIITFLFTYFSEEGEEGEARLLEFLESNLELKKR